MTNIERCTVIRTDEVNPETAVVRYRKRGDGWHVQTPKDAKFWRFARKTVEEDDLLEMIAEKWDARYGEAEPFEEDILQTRQGTFQDMPGVEN